VDHTAGKAVRSEIDAVAGFPLGAEIFLEGRHDAGVRLAGLTIRGPKAVIERRPQVSAPVPLEWVEREGASGLAATFETPAGRVTLG
jgi:hypothetical protein